MVSPTAADTMSRRVVRGKFKQRPSFPKEEGKGLPGVRGPGGSPNGVKAGDKTARGSGERENDGGAAPTGVRALAAGFGKGAAAPALKTRMNALGLNVKKGGPGGGLGGGLGGMPPGASPRGLLGAKGSPGGATASPLSSQPDDNSSSPSDPGSGRRRTTRTAPAMAPGTAAGVGVADANANANAKRMLLSRFAKRGSREPAGGAGVAGPQGQLVPLPRAGLNAARGGSVRLAEAPRGGLALGRDSRSPRDIGADNNGDANAGVDSDDDVFSADSESGPRGGGGEANGRGARAKEGAGELGAALGAKRSRSDDDRRFVEVNGGAGGGGPLALRARGSSGASFPSRKGSRASEGRGEREGGGEGGGEGGEVREGLSRQLKREVERGARMKAEYEERLSRLRAENIEAVAVARKQVLLQMDTILQKYAKLANDACLAAKRAESFAHEKTVESAKVADAACSSFEQECKLKMRDILEGYKYLADQAAQSARMEGKVLKDKARELAEKLAVDRHHQEKELRDLAERRLAPYRQEITRLERELEVVRDDASATFSDIKAQVVRQFNTYESVLLSAVLDLMWTEGLEISEGYLRAVLAKALSLRLAADARGVDEGAGESEGGRNAPRASGDFGGSIAAKTQLLQQARSQLEKDDAARRQFDSTEDMEPDKNLQQQQQQQQQTNSLLPNRESQVARALGLPSSRERKKDEDSSGNYKSDAGRRRQAMTPVPRHHRSALFMDQQ